MESKTSLRNKGFMDFVTLGGHRPQVGVGKSFPWISKNGQTQGVTTRFRSGSVTQTHMHGSAMGTSTHMNRYGQTMTLTASQMNSDTKQFVRAKHSEFKF